MFCNVQMTKSGLKGSGGVRTPEEVLGFWLDEVGEKGWYSGAPELDQEVRDRFRKTWDGVMEGACGLWLTYPTGSLAYVIVADQFSRNMFRGTGAAFASDRLGRAAAKAAISRDWDLRVDEPARQFFYMPLEHSENLIDQDRAMRLFMSRMPDTGHENLLHAKVHRQIIRRFGRFPFRNVALGRPSTAVEQAWLDAGGYGAELQAMQAPAI